MEDKQDERRLLTVPQAAEQLSLSDAKAWQLVHRGELRSIKIGWSRRIPAEAIGEFIDRLAAEQAPGVPA
jgi:excisionase family DNA binding protein